MICVEKKLDDLLIFVRENNELDSIVKVISDLKEIKFSLKEEKNYLLLNKAKNIEKETKEKIYSIKLSTVDLNSVVSIENDKFNEISMVSFLQNELYDYFVSQKYNYVVSNDIEDERVVFDSLNIDANHSSRSLKETFYFSLFKNRILRPHTTGTDIHILEKNSKGSFFTSGLVYRRDNDKNHLPAFHQFEILVIQDDVSIFILKNIILNAISFLFSKLSKLTCNNVYPNTRFRPHYFPYTSPSYELDIECFCLSKKECNFCNNGWLEILGCGIISEKISKKKCMAAGIGLSRLAFIFDNFFSEEKKNNINSILYMS